MGVHVNHNRRDARLCEVYISELLQTRIILSIPLQFMKYDLLSFIVSYPTEI